MPAGFSAQAAQLTITPLFPVPGSPLLVPSSLPAPQLSDLSLDALASGEGLPRLSRLTALRLAPQQGARITLAGLPLLRRLCLDLSAGSCGRDLLSAARGGVHVPPGGHGLRQLRELELRCFVWRPQHAGDSDDSSSSDASSSDGSSSNDASSSDGSSSSDASSSDGSSSDSGNDGSSDGSEMWEAESGADSRSDEELDAEEAEAWPQAAAEAQGGEGAAAGLRDASWAFLRRRQQEDSCDGAEVGAVVALEQR